MDGSYFVMDGQHRVAAAREIRDLIANGHTVPEEAKHYNGNLTAKVYSDLSLAEEAEMFVGLNDSKLPQISDRVAVAAIAGKEIEAGVAMGLAKYGWSLRGSNKVRSVATLLTIQRRDPSGETLNRVLNIITAAWGNNLAATNAAVLGGLGALIANNDQLDDRRLIRTLKRVTPDKVLDNARTFVSSLGTITAGAAHWMAVTYNKGLQLSDRKLES
jgi:hypothetical protein